MPDAIEVTISPDPAYTGLEHLSEADQAFIAKWEPHLPAVIREIRHIARCHGAETAADVIQSVRETLETAQQHCVTRP